MIGRRERTERNGLRGAHMEMVYGGRLDHTLLVEDKEKKRTMYKK